MKRALLVSGVAGFLALAASLEAATEGGDLGTPSQGECGVPVDLDEVFDQTRVWQSEARGLVSTGILGVPFDDSTLRKDLVVSNGNDIFPQPLTVYYARRDGRSSAFPAYADRPEWISSRPEMYGHLASGDIDRDGLLDVVAAVILAHPATIMDGGGTRQRTGGLVVHRGIKGCADGSASRNDCDLRTTLSVEPSDSNFAFSALSVSLGDVDGDGWLDLAAGALLESSSPIALPGERPKGRWRIYLNKRGKFDWKNPITSKEEFNATDVELADVNLDGRLDLVLAEGGRLHVFYGKSRQFGGSTISRTAGWSSDDSEIVSEGAAWKQFIASIDVGLLNPGVDRSATIAASTSCIVGEAECDTHSSSCIEKEMRCDARYLLYRPDIGRRSTWRFDWLGWGGEVRLRDMNGDCQTDLVAGAWWIWNETDERAEPAQLRVFAGDGSSLGSKAVWESRVQGGFVGQAIDLADFNCDAVHLETASFVSRGQPEILTLRDSNVESIRRVRIGEPGREKTLDRGEFTFAVGESWVGVPRTRRGTPIAVEYVRSRHPDIVTGTFEVDRGVYLFERNGNLPQSTCIPEGQ